jgi:hypothetical protein
MRNLTKPHKSQSLCSIYSTTKLELMMGLVVHNRNPIYSGGTDRDREFEVSPGKGSETLFQN